MTFTHQNVFVTKFQIRAAKRNRAIARWCEQMSIIPCFGTVQIIVMKPVCFFHCPLGSFSPAWCLWVVALGVMFAKCGTLLNVSFKLWKTNICSKIFIDKYFIYSFKMKKCWMFSLCNIFTFIIVHCNISICCSWDLILCMRSLYFWSPSLSFIIRSAPILYIKVVLIHLNLCYTQRSIMLNVLLQYRYECVY